MKLQSRMSKEFKENANLSYAENQFFVECDVIAELDGHRTLLDHVMEKLDLQFHAKSHN